VSENVGFKPPLPVDQKPASPFRNQLRRDHSRGLQGRQVQPTGRQGISGLTSKNAGLWYRTHFRRVGFATNFRVFLRQLAAMNPSQIATSHGIVAFESGNNLKLFFANGLAKWAFFAINNAQTIS
jgi:hypothetical protein